MATDTSNSSPMNGTMDFAPRPSAAFSSAFEEFIDRAMQAENAAQPKRDYIGASRLGEECLRKLGYEFRHTPKDEGREFGGRTLRIFERGHANEDMMARRLRLAGFTLITHRPDGNQIGFGTVWSEEQQCHLVSGHIDGVLTAGPAEIEVGGISFPLRYPCLWENKCLGDKGFKDLDRKGLRASKPLYFAQMQLYEAYLDLADNPGLFTAENANDGQLYAELVGFDRAAAQAASDKGLRVVTAENAESLPRVASKSTDFRCKFCDYAARCWKTEVAATADPLPSWGGFGVRS